MIDNSKFFNKINSTIFNKKLNESQKQGMSSLLAEWEKRKLPDVRLLAYILATAYHETATTMQPIKEYGGVAYLTSNYDIKGSNPSRARKMGNTSAGDGVKYCGRGYVQLTWKSNYARFSKEIGIDIVSDPDKAMQDDVASKICMTGLLDARCSFTGVVLTKYINLKSTDYINARRTVNGTDKASMISNYAVQFHGALT